MIQFNNTKMAQAFSHYRPDYISGRIGGILDQHLVNGSSILAVNRTKGQMPKTHLPYILHPTDGANTTDLTILMYDVNGVQSAEADLRYLNAMLTIGWEDPLMQERYLTTRKFATKAYMTWIGRSLRTRHNFSVEDQIQIDIILAVFYYSAVGNPSEIFSRAKFKSYTDIAEITMARASMILDVVERNGINEMSHFGLEEMVYMLTKVSDDTRSKISLPALQSQLSGSWVGEGRVYYSNLAMEYPPMFLTMLYNSLVERSFSRTPFSNVVQEFAVGRKSNVGEMFTRTLSEQIKSYKLSDDINV